MSRDTSELSPARIDAAVTALRQVLPLAHPADALLRRHFQDHPKLGAKDRAFVAETVFGVLRHRMTLERLAPRAAPRPLVLAYLLRFQGINLRALAPLLKEGEADWLAAAKAIPADALPLEARAEFPAWLLEKLRGFMEEADILALGRALQSGAPLDLRVNPLRASRDEALAALRAEGIDGELTPYSPVGIRLKAKPAINRHPLFLEGKVEVQDEGSQLLGYLVAPRRREMVADFCAGAGGKTLLLGALMHSEGRLYAFDVSDKRLANLRTRLKRSGLSNVHPERIAGENDTRIKRLAGKIDRVLVDAPCSGLGTLRRNPDLKWRQSAQSVEELTRKQAAILASASRLLKPGGRLVYATCSLLPEENQGIVAAFLAAHPDFAEVSCAGILAQQKIPLDTGRHLELLPHRHGTDGFFAAAMERKR
ncbi:MAG: RsmB/NOP family class I SAM-dependent RNA methyltransferase [Betaproteobacteria bacterium]|nr:RsmB/NOP family class I SAM-dependent RNA methyltransferase [Betaproteobacteria bacterium]